MTRIALVLGGTRSGKSRFAVELARQRCGQRVCYLATARPGDPELDARIAAHRRERPAAWPTREVGTDLASAIAATTADNLLLIDSLTLWVAALLSVDDHAANHWPAAEARLRRRQAGAILVSDEVGLGVVPDSPLGRRFRDELGWLNQQVATLADDVVLCVAGLPIQLRGS
jgi:adenosylcobinamide kinase/adenosylcobinamide-phosphate guanylyltransferase